MGELVEEHLRQRDVVVCIGNLYAVLEGEGGDVGAGVRVLRVVEGGGYSGGVV